MSEAPMSAMGEIKKTTSKVTTRLAEFRPEARQLTTELFRLDLMGEAARSDLFLVKDGNLRLRDQGRVQIGESIDRALRQAYGSPEIIDEAILQLRTDLTGERAAILQDKRRLRSEAKARFTGHTRRYRVQVDAYYNAALSSSDIPAREALLKRKQLLLRSYRAKIQAERTKPQRESLIEEYKQQHGKKPSAIELTKYKLEKEKAKATEEERKRRAAAAQAAYEARMRQEQRERIAAMHRKIAERRARVTRGLEFRLRGLGYELGRVLQAMRRNALQTVLVAGFIFAVGWGVGRLIKSPPVPWEQTPIYKITQLWKEHQGRYAPGSPPRIETPEPDLAWKMVSPTATPEPIVPKMAEVSPPKVEQPLALEAEAPVSKADQPAEKVKSPQQIKEEQARADLQRQIEEEHKLLQERQRQARRATSPSQAVPTQTPGAPMATELKVGSVPTEAELAADRKTKEVVIAATKEFPGIAGVRQLIIQKVEDLADRAKELAFRSRHVVNIIEFDYNWINAKRTDAERAKYYDVYAKGVIAGLRQVYNSGSHLVVILEPGHQSFYGKDNRGNKDTGSVYTLNNGKVSVEKKYNLETAKAMAKMIAKEFPNWTVVITSGDAGYEVRPLALWEGKDFVVDNVDAFFPLRVVEDKLSEIAGDKVVRFALHYNGYASSDFQRKNEQTSEMETVLRDEAANRRGGSVIPQATGVNKEESERLAKILTESLQQAVREIDSTYTAGVYYGDEKDDPYLITEGREDKTEDIRKMNIDSLKNKFNRRLALARKLGGFFAQLLASKPASVGGAVASAGAIR